MAGQKKMLQQDRVTDSINQMLTFRSKEKNTNWVRSLEVRHEAACSEKTVSGRLHLKQRHFLKILTAK